MVPFIQTRNSISVFIDTDTFEIDKSESHYQRVIDLLKEGASVDKIRDVVQSALKKIQQLVASSPNSGVSLQNGQVFFNGQPVHNTLTDRIIDMVNEGWDATPFVKFMENLMKNPSNSVVTRLYDFLEVGKNAITPDGYFLAYKAIRADWKDIHSGTFDNSIGAVNEVPRNQVDENIDNTCSYGLHVCSWGYLPNFAHANGRVVVVKVNPADVVAIPRDYNNTKMRVSRYEVVDEYKDYYLKDPQGLSLRVNESRDNVLARRAVIGDYSTPIQGELVDPSQGEFEEAASQLRALGFEVEVRDGELVAQKVIDLSDDDNDQDDYDYEEGAGASWW